MHPRVVVLVEKHKFVAPVSAVPQVIPHQVVVHQPATKVIVQRLRCPSLLLLSNR